MRINKDLKIGQVISGFKIKRIVEVKDIDAQVYELEHVKFGSKYIHIERDDKDNVFGTIFKTVPTDSTGVAHILEHCILGGSEKFPIHDPFFSMTRKSVNSFMNAFTASDWTAYPFSSPNKKDFYNMMDIYLDAVFFPLLRESTFLQEGWRYDFERDNLVYRGVVYNEMKGSLSTVDRIFGEAVLNTMYPETTYSYNSGGDPEDITKLSYDQFKEFYKNHYHPANAFFYSYGDLPLKKNLEFISKKVLSKFKPSNLKIEVPKHHRWNKPQEKEFKYPIPLEENISKKSHICVAWLTADIADSFEFLTMVLLERILLGNSSAPLYKALMDSGLGSSMSADYGIDEDFSRDTIFSVGLKNVHKSDGKKIENIVFSCLKGIVKNGIPKNLIDSAIHKLEIGHKEITSDPFPYGLNALFSILGSWLHGGDVLSKIDFSKDLNKIKKELKKGNFFEKKINQYFLNNKHRATIKVVPDKKLATMKLKEENKRLNKIKKELNKDQIKEIKTKNKELEEEQKREENTSCLPDLDLKDLDKFKKSRKDVKSMRTETGEFYDLPGSMNYFYSVFGISQLPKELFELLPFFCFCLSRMNTDKHSCVEFENLIDKYTGGISFSASVGESYGKKNESLPFVFMGSKCLKRNQKKMFSLIKELVLYVNFEDKDRLKKLLGEYKSALESSLVDEGHKNVILMASRNLSESACLKYLWSGPGQLKFINEIYKKGDYAPRALLSGRTPRALLSGRTPRALLSGRTPRALLSGRTNLSLELEVIKKIVFNKNNFKYAAVGSKKSLGEAKVQIKKIKKALIDGENGLNSPEINWKITKGKEMLLVNSQVSFAARSFRTVNLSHADSPALAVISKLLKGLFVHREVREKGGAYGGYTVYNVDSGLFYFASYRDPRVLRTLDIFSKAEDFIKSGKYTEDNVKEAILRVYADFTNPETPSVETQESFLMGITGLSDAKRKAFTDRLLKLKKKDILIVAKKYFTKKNREVAVLTFKEKAEEVNKKVKGEFDVIEV